MTPTHRDEPTLRPAIGAHISVAGGLERVLPRARAIGAEVVQIFPQSPRQWKPTAYPDDELTAFGCHLAEAGLPLYLHAIYLVNPASPDPQVRRRSAESLVKALTFGARAGARAVVCHLGGRKGAPFEEAVERVADTLAEVSGLLEEAAAPRLLLETSAGTRGAVDRGLGDLEAILRGLPGDLGLCLDTAHLFAAGHPPATSEGVAGYLAELEARLGPGRVGLVHLNDSKVLFGAGADRHENLGEGRLGLEGLAAWIRNPALREVDFVLETPGFDGKGPDRRNLKVARGLRAGIGIR